MTDYRVSLTSICTPSEDVVVRLIEGELLIVPLTAGVGDAGDELYTLNSSGQAIWQQLDGRRTLGEVVEALAQEYDAPRAVLEQDVLGLTGELLRRKILNGRDAA